ncbi:MAG: tetratricopeptide repeat protein [Alphaproteobacteria bacterium]|nr:tetratricopeptide repeat protein [Alphaproteobacteria bacterium]
MEDNIFDEITADLRRDRMAGAWAKYGRYVIGLAVAIVMLVAGVIGYDALRTGQREAASARYDALLTQVADADADEKIAQFLAFSDAEDNGYGALAQFNAALTQAENGQYDNALGGFDELAGRRSLPNSLRDFASLQAAIILLDSGGSLAEIEDRIGDLAKDENGLRPMAREVMALAYSAHDNPLEARDLLMQQIADGSVNSLARDRATIMLQSVRGGLLALPEADEDEGDK